MLYEDKKQENGHQPAESAYFGGAAALVTYRSMIPFKLSNPPLGWAPILSNSNLLSIQYTFVRP
jgi:hypothetical protein